MTERQLLPAFEVRRELPVNYASMAPGKEDFIKTRESFGPVNMYTLERALVSPYGVVFRNGRVIRESVYGMIDPGKQWPSFLKKILLGKVRQVDKPCLVGHHVYYDNYFHWMGEILPRLYLVWKTLGPGSACLLIHEKQPAFVRETLDLFGLEVIPVRDDELVRPQLVYFTSHIARPLAYHEGLMRELSYWLREKFNDPAAANSPEKIFISRENARYRITRNEAAIREYLVSKGFSVIAPEKYTVKQQMNLFKRARIIIGSHGAGFSNLLFAERCELIVDIIHQDHPQDCFYNLANAFGTACYYFQCPGAGRLAYKNNDDVVADIPRFIRETEKLIS